jgi:hypothetical protein
MSWLLWAIVLLIQNASFTWVSRARNSGSVKYHAVASVFSNGVWFASQVVVVNKITDALAAGDWPLMIATGAFYTLFTVIGSISMHHFLMTRVEKGKLKVGG